VKCSLNSATTMNNVLNNIFQHADWPTYLPTYLAFSLAIYPPTYLLSPAYPHSEIIGLLPPLHDIHVHKHDIPRAVGRPPTS
jgi:hypothetical protein